MSEKEKTTTEEDNTTTTTTTIIRPVTRTKAEAKANYDQISRRYDFIEGATEQKIRNVGLQLLNASEGETILELGTGTGHAMLALAQAVGEKGHVAGIDLAPGMVAITEQRLEQQKTGLSDRVTLICDDAVTYDRLSSLPSSSSSTQTPFDGMFMSFFLELIDTPEIPIVLENVKNGLKEDGRLVVVSLSKENSRMVRLYECFHDRMPVLVDCRPIFVQKSLQDAGFVIQETKRMYGVAGGYHRGFQAVDLTLSEWSV